MVTIFPTENSDVTLFNKNTFDVADALLDVYPETFTRGGRFPAHPDNAKQITINIIFFMTTSFEN
jgi:hypothetical protein